MQILHSSKLYFSYRIFIGGVCVCKTETERESVSYPEGMIFWVTKPSFVVVVWSCFNSFMIDKPLTKTYQQVLWTWGTSAQAWVTATLMDPSSQLSVFLKKKRFLQNLKFSPGAVHSAWLAAPPECAGSTLDLLQVTLGSAGKGTVPGLCYFSINLLLNNNNKSIITAFLFCQLPPTEVRLN